MKHYICIMLVLFALMSAKGVTAFAEDGYKAYILMEAETGTVLEEENSDVELNAGYLSKLMSLLLIAEDIETGKLRPDTVISVPETIRGVKGAVIWLEPGDSITVDELLKSVVVGNANDAMITLALASERSIEEFVSRMNSRAFDLGLRNTAFYSPCGFYDEREYTTAHDIAVICSELCRYDVLKPYFSIWRDTVRDGKTDIISENRLTRTYPNHTGFKECHSDISGYCIAECGRNEKGETYIAVILGAEEQDTLESKAKKLLNSGFANYTISSVAFPEEFLLPIKVEPGTGRAVRLKLRESDNVIVKKGSGELTTVSVIPEFISAPVRKGQVIGSVGFYSGKKLVAESDIVSLDNIEELKWHHVFRNSLTNMFKK